MNEEFGHLKIIKKTFLGLMRCQEERMAMLGRS